MSEIRILVVDDHGVLRDAVSERLQRELDFTVVGTATDGESALALAAETRPDVILLDIHMPGMFTFEAARQLKTLLPEARIIFLSAFMSDVYIDQALDVKAHGYLTKREPIDKVIAAIREVASGGAYFSDEVRSRIVVDLNGARLSDAGASRLSQLSRREMEMLSYISQGLGKKEIAAITSLSVKTIDHHVTRLMNKLDIHDRVALTRYAIREGLSKTE